MNLLAELFAGSESYIGAIENLSEYGIYARIFHQKKSMDLTPGTALELKLKCLSGEKLNLHCEVKWIHIYETPSHDLVNSMGMNIIDPPQKYKELIRNLQSDKNG